MCFKYINEIKFIQERSSDKTLIFFGWTKDTYIKNISIILLVFAFLKETSQHFFFCKWRRQISISASTSNVTAKGLTVREGYNPTVLSRLSRNDVGNLWKQRGYAWKSRRTDRNIDHRRAIMTGDGFESGRCRAQPFQTTLIFSVLIRDYSRIICPCSPRHKSSFAFNPRCNIKPCSRPLVLYIMLTLLILYILFHILFIIIYKNIFIININFHI